MTAEQLAKLCILVLNAQKQYFASRDREDLIKSKALEAQLRTAANNILAEARPHEAVVTDRVEKSAKTEGAAVQEKMF